jgi:hypothetical protein
MVLSSIRDFMATKECPYPSTGIRRRARTRISGAGNAREIGAKVNPESGDPREYSRYLLSHLHLGRPSRSIQTIMSGERAPIEPQLTPVAPRIFLLLGFWNKPFASEVAGRVPSARASAASVPFLKSGPCCFQDSRLTERVRFCSGARFVGERFERL